MINTCPNCKSKLLTSHAFCPSCGFDLRTEDESSKGQESQVVSGELKVIKAKNAYLIPLFAGILFSLASVFIWSYIFTGYRFDVNAFSSRLVNHTFWIFLVPYIISLFFRKAKRPNVFSNATTVAILLGLVFLFFGYSEYSNNTAPSIIRIRLLKPCTDNVILQMAKDDLPARTKEMRANAYCECLTNKVSEIDIVKIGTGQGNFWDIVNQTYRKESLECIEGSLRPARPPDEEQDILPPPPKKKKVGEA
jgi:hypothetical protein